MKVPSSSIDQGEALVGPGSVQRAVTASLECPLVSFCQNQSSRAQEVWPPPLSFQRLEPPVATEGTAPQP